MVRWLRSMAVLPEDQHPDGSPQPPVTPVPGAPVPSALCKCLHTHTPCAHIHVHNLKYKTKQNRGLARYLSGLRWLQAWQHKLAHQDPHGKRERTPAAVSDLYVWVVACESTLVHTHIHTRVLKVQLLCGFSGFVCVVCVLPPPSQHSGCQHSWIFIWILRS